MKELSDVFGQLFFVVLLLLAKKESADLGIIERLRFALGRNKAPQASVQEIQQYRDAFKDLADEISKVDASHAAMQDWPAENPDELVAKKGLVVYKQMLDDDQVRAALTTKKFAALSPQWGVYPGDVGEDEALIADAEMQARFIEYNLEHLEGTIEDALLDVLSAMEYGYSITEKVFYRIPEGEFKGMIGLKKLATRAPFDYRFRTDEHNNIDPDRGIVFSPDNTDFPMKKFIVYTYNKRFGDPYGQSDLKSAYRSHLSKNFIIKFWNIYLEKFSIPTLGATVPKRFSKTTNTNVMNMLKNWQAATTIKIPEDVKLEILESTRRGDTGFQEAIEAHNTMIARAILVPDLIGFTDIQGGSFALGKKQFNVFIWIVGKIDMDLEETVMNEQVIRQLIDLNFNNIKAYPYFKFDELTEENIEGRAKVIEMAATQGIIDPDEAWVREYLQLPEAPQEEEEGEESNDGPDAKKVPPQKPPGGAGEKEEEGDDKEGADEEDDMEGMDDEKTKVKTNCCTICNTETTLKEYTGFYETRECANGHTVLRSVTGELFRLCGKVWRRHAQVSVSDTRQYQGEEGRRFDKQVNYKEIERGLDKFQEEAIELMVPIFQASRDKLLRIIERSGFFETLDPNILKELDFSFGPNFKKVLKSTMIKTHLFGVLNALSELMQKGVEDLTVKAKFADIPLSNWVDVEPEIALEIFNKKVLATIIKNGQKKALKLFDGQWLKYYDRKAFAITGIEEAEILKQAKVILLEGIRKEGPKLARDKLNQLFDKYIEKGIIKDGKVATQARLNTIIRTNFTEDFNSGREAIYKDEDLKDFVSNIMWSSVTDSVTTPYCLSMDGKVFSANDPHLIPPPAHFNCVEPTAKVVMKKTRGNYFIKKTKWIKHIQVGEEVLTDDNTFHKVTNTFSRDYDGNLFEIVTETGETFRVTPEHPVWVENQGWVEAQHLGVGDVVRKVDKRIEFRFNELLKPIEKKICADYEAGRSYRYLKKKYGTVNQTLTKILQRNNVHIRRGSEAVKTQWVNNDSRRRAMGQVFREYKKHPDFIHPMLGKKHSIISKKRMSEKNRMHNPASIEKMRIMMKGKFAGDKNPMYGKSPIHLKKLIPVETPLQGIKKMRSSYEKIFAEYHNLIGTNYLYEPQRFKLSNGTTYLPDFKMLDEQNVYIEIKGWVKEKDIEKMECFRKDHPQLKLLMITKDKIMEMKKYADKNKECSANTV